MRGVIKGAFIVLISFALTPTYIVIALPAVESYEQLVSAIRQAKAESRERIETLVESEKIREAWKIGKLIDTHVLQHQQRADYDKQVIQRLAQDLDSSPTEISYMLQFARAYPIFPQAEKLSWAHYRELLSLNDSKEREEIAKQAAQEGWGRDRVREEVHRRQALRKGVEQKEPEVPILTVVFGTPGMYRVVKANYGKRPNELVLDLGFSNYLSLRDIEGKFSFREGDIIKVHKDELELKKEAQDSDLFTYKAYVLKIIDGDTFSAVIELGFGFTTVQTLRLRGLDAPEIVSAEGREAKEFLERELLSFPRKRESTISGSPIKTFGDDRQILIKTHRSDKYDRYLADVFVNGEYLNQKLVEQGFAEQVDH